MLFAIIVCIWNYYLHLIYTIHKSALCSAAIPIHSREGHNLTECIPLFYICLTQSGNIMRPTWDLTPDNPQHPSNRLFFQAANNIIGNNIDTARALVILFHALAHAPMPSFLLLLCCSSSGIMLHLEIRFMRPSFFLCCCARFDTGTQHGIERKQRAPTRIVFSAGGRAKCTTMLFAFAAFCGSLWPHTLWMCSFLAPIPDHK